MKGTRYGVGWLDIIERCKSEVESARTRVWWSCQPPHSAARCGCSGFGFAGSGSILDVIVVAKRLIGAVIVRLTNASHSLNGLSRRMGPINTLS